MAGTPDISAQSEGKLNCPECGYQLRGSVVDLGAEPSVRLPTKGAQCPECGKVSDLQEIHAGRLRTSARTKLILSVLSLVMLIAPAGLVVAANLMGLQGFVDFTEGSGRMTDRWFVIFSGYYTLLVYPPMFVILWCYLHRMPTPARLILAFLMCLFVGAGNSAIAHALVYS